MIFANLPVMKQIHARVNKTLNNGIQLNMSTEESKKLLRRHVNSKTNLVIAFIDINNSTQMSLSLPENKFALMIQTFAQEISIAALGYGGYIFKYEGDAVIVFFPAEYDPAKACKNALNCSRAILEIIREDRYLKKVCIIYFFITKSYSNVMESPLCISCTSFHS